MIGAASCVSRCCSQGADCTVVDFRGRRLQASLDDFKGACHYGTHSSTDPTSSQEKDIKKIES